MATHDSELKHKKRGMVRWYNPLQLVRTAIDVFVSEVLKERADARLLEVQTGKEPLYKEGKARVDEDGFWFDYIADTGDGWDTTYAIARLLSSKTLQIEGKTLTRGQFLVMGGDEVYPVASGEMYRARLLTPFKAACEDREKPDPAPHVYAIPGNHDWYDGLISFLRLFTKAGRRVGFWRTRQHRSYFAIKLPENWWIWGTDTQLQGNVDEPQRAFFENVIDKKLGHGDRVIACTPTPDWIYEDNSKDPDLPGHLHLASGNLKRKEATLPLQISGDIHNYQRFDSQSDNGYHKIVAGGGGAFMHPTHRQRYAKGSTYKREQEYPSTLKSFGLSFGCFLLPFLNPCLVLLSAPLYLAFSWSMFRVHTLHDLVLQRGISITLAVGFVAICMFYADPRRWYRLWGGFPHGVVQVVVAYMSCRAVIDWRGQPQALSLDFLGTLGLVALAGFLLVPFILGVYLFTSLNVFGFHPNEAFSALRIKRYKNFLRFCIRPGGELEIYAIGLNKPGGKPHLIDEVTIGGSAESVEKETESSK